MRFTHERGGNAEKQSFHFTVQLLALQRALIDRALLNIRVGEYTAPLCLLAAAHLEFNTTHRMSGCFPQRGFNPNVLDGGEGWRRVEAGGTN